MKIHWVGLFLVVALFLLNSSTSADERGLVRARLTGFQEVPANSTTGHGEFRARIGETSLEFELTYEDMEDPVAVAHVHLGQRGVNGGVIFFLCGGGGRPACTSPSGNFSGAVTAADIIGPAGQGIAAGEFEESCARCAAEIPTPMSIPYRRQTDDSPGARFADRFARTTSTSLISFRG